MQAMLWIMRHASAGPTTDAKDDDKRPLDKFGVMQATAAGIALKKLKTPIQCCLASPLTRALQTAEIVCKELGIDVESEPLLSGPPVHFEQLVKGKGNCLVVSHSPSCDLNVYRLTGAQVKFAKGGVGQIHEGEIWTMLNPSTCYVMADMAKFGDPQEVDERQQDDPSFAYRAWLADEQRQDAWRLKRQWMPGEIRA